MISLQLDTAKRSGSHQPSQTHHPAFILSNVPCDLSCQTHSDSQKMLKRSHFQTDFKARKHSEDDPPDYPAVQPNARLKSLKIYIRIYIYRYVLETDKCLDK